MKTIKFVSLFLLAVFCFKSFAHENTQNVTVRSTIFENYQGENHRQISDPHQAKIEKRYIDPTQVCFEQKEIYVQLDQNWVVTNAVYTDADGFYILEPKSGWTCGYCGYYNEGNIWTCESCGRKRD